MMVVRVFEDNDQVSEVQVPYEALREYMRDGLNPTEAALAYAAPERCPFDCDHCRS